MTHPTKYSHPPITETKHSALPFYFSCLRTNIYLSLSLSVYLSIYYLSIIYPSVSNLPTIYHYLPIYYLPIYLLIYLSTYLSISNLSTIYLYLSTMYRYHVPDLEFTVRKHLDIPESVSTSMYHPRWSWTLDPLGSASWVLRLQSNMVPQPDITFGLRLEWELAGSCAQRWGDRRQQAADCWRRDPREKDPTGRIRGPGCLSEVYHTWKWFSFYRKKKHKCHSLYLHCRNFIWPEY